ncbi:MAG: sulfur carrier protein ThiS [Proteobacteria bacterium]|nr:sulfur carrier protein ThiS [Pseudomonadota bacterium]
MSCLGAKAILHMKILLNGEMCEFEETKTITDLVSALSLEPKVVLIEHNGIALHRSEWSSCILSDGDRIEILQVAAGG